MNKYSKIFLVIILFVIVILFYSLCLQNTSEHFIPQWTQNDTTSNYHLLISAQCSMYQDWQVIGCVYSAIKNWKNVKYTRLLGCNEKGYKYINIVPTFISNDWATHPKTKDVYPPYNRPYSIKNFLEKNPEKDEYFVIIDPDTIICKPMDDIRVNRGSPVGQLYEYLHNDNALRKLTNIYCKTKKEAQPIGMPIIIHSDDLRLLTPLWLEMTEKIRNDPKTKKLSGWIAEMHGYCLAAAELGIIHTVRNDLADRTPYNRIKEPYVLHYDLKHELKEWKWDKRDYRLQDLLDKNGELMPIPKESPNKYFSQVFELLNEALQTFRNGT